MEFKKVIYDTSNHVATILLNRPKAMNAFETQLRLDLMAAIRQAEGDDDVRVIIISGAGRGFSAGADLQRGIEPYDTIEDQILAEYKPFLMAIHNSPKLFISAVNATGGFLAGDSLQDVAPWLQLLIAYDAIIIAISFMTFDFVVEE